MKKITCITAVVALLALAGFGIHYSSRISPYDPTLSAPFQLLPSPVNGGLKSSSESFWGASGIVDKKGKYHLFASRIANQCGLNTWDFNSEIVRATADNPLGPYQVEEVVLPAMAHNPTVLQDKQGKYHLIYIGQPLDDSELVSTCKNGQTLYFSKEKKAQSSPWRCSINMVSADSPSGPWSSPKKLLSGLGYPVCATNPAPVLNDDGSVDLYYRAYRYLVTDDKSDKSRYHPYPQEWLYLATAENIHGDFNRFAIKPVLQGQGEDAFVWDDNNGRHMVFNNKFNQKYHMGGYARATSDSHFNRGKPLYNDIISFDDGSQVKISRRERPQIMWLSDQHGVLFQGVRPERKSDYVYTLATPIGSWPK